MQNDVIMETNDDEVEEEEPEEVEEQNQRPVRRKKDKLCATGGHNLKWRNWFRK